MRPQKGECVIEITNEAARMARLLYDRPVKVMVLVYLEDGPARQSQAGTDFDRERAKAAMRKALADMEGQKESHN